MKILHLSDTHSYHKGMRNLPEADVVVHSGDFCMLENQREALDFLNWFSDLPYAHKIFICGNHDDILYNAQVEGLDENVHYLNNSGITIEGLKFYGVPMFMADAIGRQDIFYKAIPDDIDVLVTHSPPFGIMDYDMDRHWGSELLLDRVEKVHPKAHLFGHIHLSHGMVEKNGIIFSNAAIMHDSYSSLNSPNVIEI